MSVELINISSIHLSVCPQATRQNVPEKLCLSPAVGQSVPSPWASPGDCGFDWSHEVNPEITPTSFNDRLNLWQFGEVLIGIPLLLLFLSLWLTRTEEIRNRTRITAGDPISFVPAALQNQSILGGLFHFMKYQLQFASLASSLGNVKSRVGRCSSFLCHHRRRSRQKLLFMNTTDLHFANIIVDSQTRAQHSRDAKDEEKCENYGLFN